MTSQKFYGILVLIDALDKRLGLQKDLESVGNALTNLVSAPAQPEHQSALAGALASFEKAADKLGELITPSQLLIIREMGGEDFFEPSMLDKVRTAIQTNAMTPSVAKDFVRDLAKRRSTFLETVREARESLKDLNIGESALEPGSADLAFLIPRDIFENQLGSFAKELSFISLLIQDFSEAVTGNAEPTKLEELSSSLPTVTLAAGAKVIEVIASVVNKFLEAWAKIEKIRKMRAELTDMGLKGTAVEELTEQMTTTVDEVVEESIVLALGKYKDDRGRRNELLSLA